MKQQSSAKPVSPILRRWDLLPNALGLIQKRVACDEAAAFEQLKAFLFDGRVHAQGPWRGRGLSRDPLATEEWPFAAISPDAAGVTFLGSLSKVPWIEIDMDELRVALDQVPVPRPSKGAGDPTAALEALIHEIKSDPHRRTKSQHRADVVQRFGITGRTFDNHVWPQALERTGKTAELTKPGRKPKSNQRTK